MFSVALLLLLAAGSCVKCQQLTQPASVTVQPGQPLTITCQVSYSVSGYRTAWIRQPAGKGLEWIGSARSGYTTYYKDSLKNKFSIELDSSSNTVTLNGQNVQPEDTAVYYCARRSNYDYFDYWGKGTMVTVSSVTAKPPSGFPLISCDSDSVDVTLGCLVNDFTPSEVTFSWTKDGTALTDFVKYPTIQQGDFYTGVSKIRVKRQEWEAEHAFKCTVAHSAGGVEVTIPRPVGPFCQEPTVTVMASFDDQNEASFSCFAKYFSPKDYEIKWIKGDAEFTDKIYVTNTPVEETTFDNGTKLYSVGSFLKVKSSDVPENTEVTCQFIGKHSGCNKNTNGSVTNKPCVITGECPEADVEITIKDPTVEGMLLHKKGTVTCEVKVNRPSVDKIFWEDQDGNEMAGAITPPENTKDTFRLDLDITYDEWTQGVKRTCVVEHRDWILPLRKSYERKAGGPPQRPSVFMLPPVEHTRKQTVTLTCYVKDFFPKEVYVSWLVDDEAADPNFDFSTTNPIENHGTYSAYGHLTISLEQWKNNDVVYSCVVYHPSVVNDTRAIVRSIGHRTFAQTNMVNLNMNIPETCKAQ